MRENLKLLVVAVAAASLVSVLTPLGAQAAGTLMTIVDDDTASKAQVVGGRLSVGDGSGRLTTEGRTDRLLAMTDDIPQFSTWQKSVDVAAYSSVRFHIHNGADATLDVWLFSEVGSAGERVTLSFVTLVPGESFSVIHELPGRSLTVRVENATEYTADSMFVLWGRT